MSFHDVTKLKRLEGELGEALNLALEASRLKSDFLATVSHEIRTPLNGIIGLTALLRETDLDSDQRDYVEGAHFSGEALLTIINDVLDFSKIEAGKLELETVEFEVGRSIDEVVSLVAQQARAKNLDLAIESSGTDPVRLMGDVGRLRQIVLNLLSNAIKFTDEGSVTVRACTTWAPAMPSRKVLLRLEVEDTGVGVAEADRNRLFDPFTQVDSSTTRRYGGTGLGLAICARLAAEMGGTIGVSSNVGAGSNFWVEIPFAVAAPVVAAEPVAERVPTYATAPVRAGERVLIVEDNVVNQLVTKQMVRRLGYESDIVANGIEALAALERRHYSVVVMDCFMPDMDGFVATAEIRRSEGDGRHTPIIALTAGGTAEDRERCRNAGMDDYLMKPVDATKLASALERWMSGTTSSV